MKFRTFIEQASPEENKDVQVMLSKLPPSHAALVKGYKWQMHGGNTLDGDDQHVGYMDDQEKEIAVAAPWHYGREFTFLHEIAHRVLEKLVPPKWKQVWNQIYSQTPNQKQSAEEMWCMAYANHFAKHKIESYNHPTWQQYMTQFCQQSK